MPPREAFDILRDLAVVMTIAGAVLLIFHRLRQPIILGYIIAGIIIGPFTPPFSLVQETGIINVLADLGIVLLMYTLGLEFSLRKFRRVARVAIIGGALQILIVFGLGYHIGLLLGWSTITSVFLGASLSISSTALIVKVLQDQRLMSHSSSQVVMGILVFEDFAAIAMMAILSGVGTAGPFDLSTIGGVFLKVLLFGGLSLGLGLGVVPRVMHNVIATGKRELFVVVGLAVCFGLALVSRALGLSVATGAFLAGVLVAEAARSEVLVHTMEPIKDMFAALFFVAIGMLLNPAYLRDYWPHILLLTVALAIGKTVAGSFAAFLLGHDRHTAIQVGMKLAQIGEFSLIIAKIGQDTGAVQPFLYPVIVGVTGLSTLTTPYVIKTSLHAGERLDRLLKPRIRGYLRSAELVMQRFNSPPPQSGFGWQLTRSARGIAINLFLVTLAIVLGRLVFEHREFIGQLIPLSPPGFVLADTGLVLVLAAAPVIAIVRYVQSLAAAGAECCAGLGKAGEIVNKPVARVILRNAVGIMLFPLGVMIVNLALPPIPAVPHLPFLLLAFAVFMVLYLVASSVRTYHQRLEKLLMERLLGDEDDEDCSATASDQVGTPPKTAAKG